MSTVSSSVDRVNLLRGGYANRNPKCFCQCGKFCPGADACVPVQGEVHQPYYTIRETLTPRGRAWAGCLYDPQAQRYIVHTLLGRWWPTPCAAAALVLQEAVKSKRHPVRLDLAVIAVDLAAIEERLAQSLFERGYDLFLAHASTSSSSASEAPHPLIEAGYRAAVAEAEAAIIEKEAGFVWDLPVAVSWNTAPALVTTSTAGDYRCRHCGTHYDPTGHSCCPGCGK